MASPSDSGEVCHLNGRNSDRHIESYPRYEWMACTEKETHELGSPSTLELVTPERDISHKAKFSFDGEGVGDVHSSYDRWNNITHQERRDITIVEQPK